MQFTQVIFNTYGFFLESEAKAKSIQPFLTFKNSLLLSYCVNAKNIFSTNAPLKFYLSIKLATRLLGDNLALPFLLLVHNQILNLSLIANSKYKTQGK